MSALYICEGFLMSGRADATHLALDPAQATRFADCGLQALEEAGVRGMVEHEPQISQWLLPKLWEEGREFDLAFVDGNHRFDFVFLDLFYLNRLVRPGGVIMLDDYNYPGIARAAAFWTANLEWAVEETAGDEDNGRWVVLRTSTEEDTRDYRYFVEF